MLVTICLVVIEADEKKENSGCTNDACETNKGSALSAQHSYIGNLA